MLALALQAVTAFNLICTGTFTTGPNYDRPREPVSGDAPFSIVYRVDLARARYCVDDCASVEPLAGASEYAIVFQNSDYLSGLESGTVIFMDRTDGRYIGNAVGTETVRHRGRCEHAPFSGFPAALVP